MEMLRDNLLMSQKELAASLKQSELRERMMMDRQEKITPHEHGNRKERRAFQAQLRKQKREFA